MTPSIVFIENLEVVNEAQAISDSLAWEKFYSQLLQFIGGAFLKPVRSRFYYLKGMK